MAVEMTHQFYNSTYTGTGAAKTIVVGFKPKKVTIINTTDNDSIAYFFDGMTNGTAYAIGTAFAIVASEGITTGNNYVTLGTDANVNESAKVFRIICE